MAFPNKIILGITVLISILFNSFKLEKSKSEIFIFNDNMQCKDCPVEIGQFLNKLNYKPYMSYYCENIPLVIKQKEDFLKTEYGDRFEFTIKKINHFPKSLKTISRFPVLIKVNQSDTLILN